MNNQTGTQNTKQLKENAEIELPEFVKLVNRLVYAIETNEKLAINISDKVAMLKDLRGAMAPIETVNSNNFMEALHSLAYRIENVNTSLSETSYNLSIIVG